MDRREHTWDFCLKKATEYPQEDTTYQLLMFLFNEWIHFDFDSMNDLIKKKKEEYLVRSK